MRYLSPSTLTTDEQRALLEASEAHPRDNVIISIALGTGLRLGEIVGLDVGDVYSADGRPRTRFFLRPEITKRSQPGDAFLPDQLLVRLGRLWRFKVRIGELTEPNSPLLCAQGGKRISNRRVQTIFRHWQQVAGV